MVKKLLLFMLAFSYASANNFSVSLELAGAHYIKGKTNMSPTVFVGDSFKLKAVVSGGDKAPNDIHIAGLGAFSVLGESTSSNVRINNGETSIKKTTSYTLVPTQRGHFTIGPATLQQNGDTISSNKVTLQVLPQSKKPVQTESKPTRDAATTHEVICKLTANKASAVTEEPIEITISTYMRGNVAGLRAIQPPAFPNCSVKEVPKTREYKQNMNGKTYAAVDKKFLIYPNKEGKLYISPAQVVYQIRRKRPQRSMDIFGHNFFSNFFDVNTEQKATASNSLVLSVNKLPAYHKKVDAIGKFNSFTATVNKTHVTANEPVTLKLALNGDTNFDLVLKPELNIPREFKSYDSKTSQQEHEKVFEFILQIPQAGNWTIPEQELTYFDTSAKQYKTMKTKPITLTTTIPEGSTSAPVITEDEETPVPAAKEDIHFIQEETSGTQTKSSGLALWFFILLLLLIPCMAYHKRISHALMPLYKKLAPKNVGLIYKNKLQEIVEERAPGKCYNMFMQLLAEMFKEPVTEDLVKKKLLKYGLTKEKIDSFMLFLNECAQYSFTSQEMQPKEFNDFMQKANYWLVILTRGKS